MKNLLLWMALFLIFSCNNAGSGAQQAEDEVLAEEQILPSPEEAAPAEGFPYQTESSREQDFWYDPQTEVILGFPEGNTYLYYMDGVASRGSYGTEGSKRLLGNARGEVWAEFDEQKGLLSIPMWGQDFKLKKAASFEISDKTTELRLLIINPSLSWYDSELQYTIASNEDVVIYQTQVEPVLDFAGFLRNNVDVAPLREAWRAHWECALFKDPKYLSAWLEDFRVDMLGFYLYGNETTSAEMEKGMRAKLKALTARFPGCFPGIEALL